LGEELCGWRNLLISAVDSAARLLGVQKERFLEAILRPTIDVSYGRVTKIESLLKVANTIETLTSVIYKRLFAWLVERCNSVLMADVKSNSTNSIGILDIAGFKVLEHDSFELLWRNLLNEKMQQYVNEQMFIEAQEEYQREALGWQLIDFGHNRQSCIDLIEKCPLGIVSLLEEECALQNGDETAFVQKLKNIYLGKNHYLLDELSTVAKQSKSYFAIRHFAGIVHYNAVGWIEKNKDVLSESLVSVLKSSHKDTLTNRIFAEYSSKLDIWTRVLKGTTVAQKRSERVTLRSISHSNRESLYNLMKMLEVTTPHFVRCIVANRDNVSGMIDATLVLNQIAYNGILEAARIYRKGFSNQIEFFKFHRRYSILTPEESASSKDDRHVADAMLRKLVRHLRMPITQFHVGKTKVCHTILLLICH
uniref:Myosin motor domain-containing protein n=1 Tax=Toxocara canis TaxID=6265 RepID=A0A183V3M7_TOXCA